MAGAVEEPRKEEEEAVKVFDQAKAEVTVEDVSERLEQAKVEDEEVAVAEKLVEDDDLKADVEAKTGVSFPVKLADGKLLNTMGVRKKKILAIGINIYAFGMYYDNVKLKELVQSKFVEAPRKPTKEMYEAVIDSDVGAMVRLVIVFGGLTMSTVRKNFDEGLGASIKKLTGGRKDDELANKVMGSAKDSTKLSPGSIIEITRFPGYVLQTKVKDELISRVESELLCRAYFHMYLGDDAFDKEAKERFGASLLSLF